MDVRRQLGIRIKELREIASLSQEELAHRSSVHVTYLSGMENGKRNPSLLVLNRVATALNVKLGELFGRI